MSERTEGTRRLALGRAGEQFAAAYLSRRGYVIEARNWRTRAGEIDLVARDGDWLVFVEVRSRVSGGRIQPPVLGTPEESVTAHKQQQLVAMAEAYLFERPWEGRWRIDILALEFAPDGLVARVNHLKDAVGGPGS